MDRKVLYSPDKVNGAILGLVVGDALGVPAEFMLRSSLGANPVKDMRSGGAHSQPKGTWSDDSSLTLCLLESLCKGLNYSDIMELFSRWANDAYMTAHDRVFDMGCTTREAITRYMSGVDPLKCGGKDEYDNGNGSLMRVLPIVFYLLSERSGSPNFFRTVHNVSALTHAHGLSLISCGIYCSVAAEILLGRDKVDSVCFGCRSAIEYYRERSEYVELLPKFSLLPDKLYSIPEDDIRSGGFVVDTLHAALWCFITTDSYRDCVLKAVNLGYDSDTTAAVAGGLAGLYYGLEAIPEDWLECLARKDSILKLCRRFTSRYCDDSHCDFCGHLSEFQQKFGY